MNTPSSRIASVDLIRGAVMILMAVDHVRVYSGVPAGGPDPAVFFTRWITHFCAPAFVFLAGTSAFLYGQRRPGLPRFLVTRGLWLVLLELTVLRVAWTFNLDFGFQMAGVIWVIGWCLVLLAGLVKLPLPLVAGFGLLVVFGHDLADAHLDTLTPALAQSPLSGLWKIVYLAFWAGPISLGDNATLIVLYTVVPWVGVMAAGYGFGRILLLEPARRNRLCLAIGLGACALFLVLRGLNLYGDPRPWSADGDMPALLSFLNTSKYPASLLFLLMTLGPAVALVPALERARGPVANWVAIFGRVPFFFYVLHIPLIHTLALLVCRIKLGAVSPWLFANHPMGAPPAPDGYRWSLPLLYLVWAVAIVILTLACRRYEQFKRTHTSPWLRYL